MYICIYGERERESEREKALQMPTTDATMENATKKRRGYIYIYIYNFSCAYILRLRYLPARRAMKPGGLPREVARKVYEL